MEIEMALSLITKNMALFVCMIAIMSLTVCIIMCIVLFMIKAGRFLIVNIKQAWNETDTQILESKNHKRG